MCVRRPGGLPHPFTLGTRESAQHGRGHETQRDVGQVRQRAGRLRAASAPDIGIARSIDREAVEESGAAGDTQVVLAAAA